MKTEEDEAFDDLAKKQGAWGGGFQAKRAAAADKLQEPIYNITVFDNAYPKGIPLEDWVQPAQSIKVEGLLHFVCQCDKCKALPVQPDIAALVTRIQKLDALLERQTARIVDLQTHIENFDGEDR